MRANAEGALRLNCDNVIVGGGLAGLLAALRLKGRTILLSGGLGATAISSGVFSPAGGDQEAEEYFLSLMRDTGCRYARGACGTESGMVKEGLLQVSTLYEGRPVFVSVNEARPGFVPVTFKNGRSHQEIARMLESDSSSNAVTELAGALSCIKAGSILLPPILGIRRADEIRSGLSDALGVEVGEYVSAPSVLGLRLLNALRVKVAASDSVEMLDVVRVARVSGGHVEGRMGTNGRREVIVGADNLIIATGGLLNGLQVDGDRVFEPLTGATVSRDFEADLNQVFLSEHPLMHKGIPRELFINGFDNVRAIGAVSRGFGLYEALVSGYHAGDGL